MSPRFVIRPMRQKHRIVEARAGGGGGGASFSVIQLSFQLLTQRAFVFIAYTTVSSYVQLEAPGLALELALPCVAMVRII
jgi:hypothetical protein